MLYLIFILLITLTPLVFALTQRDLLRNLKNPSNGEYNRGWHDFQWVTMLLVCSLGYVMSYISWYYYPAEAFILWTLSDGYQNRLKGDLFWTVNVNSKDIFMPVSMWCVKIPLLVLSFLFILIQSNYFGNIL